MVFFSITAIASEPQTVGGSFDLTGRVVDPTGAVLVGASARLSRPGTGFLMVSVTDPNGEFRFSRLVAGSYQLSVSAPDFATAQLPVSVQPGASQPVVVTLNLRPVAQEVVVSAQSITGSPERIQQIPGSVDILDKETLENARAFNFTEVLRKVAGIYVREDEGFGARPHIGIRGVNSTRATKVLLLEDGIPLTYAPYGDNASYFHPPVDRYESIEILKGSGQILYGPVTVGGVINYLTPAPPPKPSGLATLIGGNRDYFNGHVNYGWTWRNTGVLLDFLRKQGDGARENVHSGINDANFKLLFVLASRQALTVRGNFYNEKSNVTYSGLREDEFRRNPRQNPFRNDFFFADRYGLSLTHSYVMSNSLTLTTNAYSSFFYRDWWRQSSNSAQRPNDAADPACGGMENLNTTCGNQGRLRDYYHWGVEPRLHAAHRLFGLRNEADFGVRVHYEYQSRRQRNGDTPTARTGLLVEDNERRNSAYAAFVQNRFFFGKWALTPGLRVEHIDYERTNRLGNGGRGVTGATSLTELVPGIGVSYSPSPRFDVFFGIHRGFAPPRTEDIISNSTGDVVELDPERSWNYELGFRSRPHAALLLEATVFRMDYENQVVPASVAGGVGATLTNGGETLHQGLELTTRLDTGLLLHSAHNFYARAAFTYLPIVRFESERFSSVPGSGVSVSGNRLPYAPERWLNFTLGYSHPRGVNGLVEMVYVSSQFSDDLNTIAPMPDGQRGLIPAYPVFNATFNYYVEQLRSTLFVSVKNLLDRTYIMDRTRGILPGSPRLAQVGFKFNF